MMNNAEAAGRLDWRNQSLASAALIVTFAIFTILPSLADVPLAAGDRAFFVPVAYFIRNGLSWISPIATVLDPMSPAGEPARYVFHGWLYPWLIALLSPGGGWQEVFMGKAIVATLAYATLVVTAVRTLHRPTSWLTFGVVAAAVVAYQDGRPETIATPLLLILASRTLTGRFCQPVDVGLFVLLFLAQPTVCMSAAAGYSFYRLSVEPGWRSLGAIAMTGGLAITISLLLFLVVYPFSLTDWAVGVINQAVLLAARHEWAGFGQYYVTNNQLPLVIVPVVGAAVTLALSARSSGGGASAIGLRLLAVVAFLVLLLFGAFKVPGTVYNVVPWVLVAAWYWLMILKVRGTPAVDRWVARGSLAVLIAGAGVGFARYTFQNAVSAMKDHGTLEAGQVIARQIMRSCSAILVSPGLVPLLGDQAGSARISYEGRPQAGRDPDVGEMDAYIRAQFGTGAQTPGPIHGMTLAYSNYAPFFRIGHLTVFRTQTNHRIAVYLRNGTTCLERFGVKKPRTEAGGRAAPPAAQPG